MTVTDALSESWGAVKRRFSVIIVSTLVILTVLVPLIMLHGSVEHVVSDELVLYSVTGALGVFVLYPTAIFLRLGLLRVLLSAYRKRDTSVAALFGQWRSFVPALLANTLFEVAAGLVAAPLMVLALALYSGSPLVTSGLGLVALIPYLLLSVRFCLWLPFMIERELSPIAALQASFQATRGHYAVVLGLLVLGGILLVVGFLACGVGVLVAWPLSEMLVVHAYVQLSQPLSRCPLCQEEIPADRDRCVGCDEWAPIRGRAGARCRHCQERVSPDMAACPYCAEPEPVERPEDAPPPPEPWRIHAPARPHSAFLAVLALALAIPHLTIGDDLSTAHYIATSLVRRFSTLPSWLAISLTSGLAIVPTLACALVILHREVSTRGSDASERGVALGRTPTWRGVEIPWDQILGFRIVERGVMLRVLGNPLSRWWGPTLLVAGQDVHDLVVRLEERGILNLSG